MHQKQRWRWLRHVRGMVVPKSTRPPHAQALQASPALVITRKSCMDCHAHCVRKRTWCIQAVCIIKGTCMLAAALRVHSCGRYEWIRPCMQRVRARACLCACALLVCTCMPRPCSLPAACARAAWRLACAQSMYALAWSTDENESLLPSGTRIRGPHYPRTHGPHAHTHRPRGSKAIITINPHHQALSHHSAGSAATPMQRPGGARGAPRWRLGAHSGSRTDGGGALPGPLRAAQRAGRRRGSSRANGPPQLRQGGAGCPLCPPRPAAAA